MSGRATDAALNEAKIEVLDGRGSPKDEIPVLFKPTEYSLDKSVRHGDQRVPGNTSPVSQFVSGDAETLSMDLFFDTYEEEGQPDVRGYTDRLDGLMKVDSESDEPPICRFVWGSLVFKSVLEQANKQFTMFLPDGTPVRARVSVTFKGYKTPLEQRAEQPRRSTDRTKVVQVTEGDTLWAIAAEEYGDPTGWRTIAAENGVDNPRTLQPGRELVVPPRR